MLTLNGNCFLIVHLEPQKCWKSWCLHVARILEINCFFHWLVSWKSWKSCSYIYLGSWKCWKSAKISFLECWDLNESFDPCNLWNVNPKWTVRSISFLEFRSPTWVGGETIFAKDDQEREREQRVCTFIACCLLVLCMFLACLQIRFCMLAAIRAGDFELNI